jgi:hypothetical protein
VERLQAVLDALPDPAANHGRSNGTILQADESWLRPAACPGFPVSRLVKTVLPRLLGYAADQEEGAEPLRLALAELCRGERAQVIYTVDGRV